jgi:hypothetical protein
MTRLGEHGPDVSRVGLGCMGMSGMYGGWLGHDPARCRRASDLRPPDRVPLISRGIDRDIEEIEQAMPAEAAVGDRYPEAQMGQLDSER